MQVARLRKIVRFLPRLLNPGGLAGVEVPDPRIRPYIVVDPFRIERKLDHFKEKRGRLFRSDLDFDGKSRPVAQSEQLDYRARFLREVFVEGQDLQDTTEFDWHLKRIARNGHTRDGYTTEAQVLAYLEKKVRIFEEIRASGQIRPTRELFGKRGDEIDCIVDQHGNLVKAENGNNRFWIARMLGFRAIPVQIDFIHADQLRVVEQQPGWTAIGKVNAYVALLQTRHAPPLQTSAATAAVMRPALSPAE